MFVATDCIGFEFLQSPCLHANMQRGFIVSELSPNISSAIRMMLQRVPQVASDVQTVLSSAKAAAAMEGFLQALTTILYDKDTMNQGQSRVGVPWATMGIFCSWEGVLKLSKLTFQGIFHFIGYRQIPKSVKLPH